MRRRTRVARVKAALVRSIEAAKRKGAVIICENSTVERDDGAFGCCALASLDVSRLRGPRVPFSHRSEEMAAEWDSIEMGFDGVLRREARTQDGEPVRPDFWRIGYDLRRRFRPVTADAFLGEHEVATKIRVRFT